MPELTNDPDFVPYDSPDYERDEHGNIKIYDPEPTTECHIVYGYRGLPWEFSINPTAILEEELLKHILRKL